MRTNPQPSAVEEVLRSLAVQKATAKSPQRLAIKSGKTVVLITVREIEWIRDADNCSELHVANSVHLLRKTISNLERELPSNQFLRISRSLIVNVDRLMEVRPKSHGDFWMVLRNGQALAASRNFRDGLQKLLGKLD